MEDGGVRTIQGDESIMEDKPTMVGDMKIERCHSAYDCIRITQSDEVVLVNDRRAEAFIDAIREHRRIIEESDATPEKWYVVLMNSNIRLTNLPGVPTVFTTYTAAGIYAMDYSGLERTYCAISADEYERAFGR